MTQGWTQSRYLRGALRSGLLLLGLAHSTLAHAQPGNAAPASTAPATDVPPVIEVSPGPHTAYYFGALTRLPTGVQVKDPAGGAPPGIRYEGLPRYFRHGDIAEVTLVATGASGAETSRVISITLYRPNLLSINVDDLNDWVSFLDTWPGNNLTPNMQRFADRSAVFTKAYCPAPLCTPSRASIITGRHPANSGIYFDGEWYRANAAQPGARREEALVPYLRTQGGYTTQGAGKFAHDGNENLQHWTEWLFGDPMNEVAPLPDDPYFRRPPEPRMPDESRLLASTNQGVMLVWGVSQIAAHPAEVILAPNAAAANACPDGPPLHGAYTLQVHNLSTAYTNRWKICAVRSKAPADLVVLPQDCEASAPYWADQDSGVLAPDDPLRLDDAASTAAIQVFVRTPEPFTLAIVQDSADPDAPCACLAAQEAADFGPFFVHFNGMAAEWVEPLRRGDTQRTLRITNHQSASQGVLLPAWARGGSDVSFSATEDVPEWKALIEPGGHREVVVRWAADRWIDFEAPLPLPKSGDGSPGAMGFDLNLYDAQDFRRLATVKNAFKEQPPVPGQGLEISDTLITVRVLDWLRRHAEQMAQATPVPPPFFVSAGIYHPHLPLYAPKEYFDRARAAGYPAYFDPADPKPDGNALPPWGKFMAMAEWLYEPLQTLELADDFAEAYKASIALADAHVGRILDAVEADPHLRDSTVIVLWSDNGFHLGEQRHLWKSTLWERAARVPLVVHIPGMTGRTDVDAPVSLHDLYPTLLDLAGLPYPQFLYAQRAGHAEAAAAMPDPTRAISLLPLLAQPNRTRQEYDTVPASRLAAWFPATGDGADLLPATEPVPVITSFTRPPLGAKGPGSPVSGTVHPEGHGDVPIHSARDATHRYIQYSAASDQGNELYDLEADPTEAHNLLPHVSIPDALRDALHFEAVAPLDPYTAASAETYVTGGPGRPGILSNPIVTESCALTAAGEIVHLHFILHTTGLTNEKPVYSVTGTFYFDRTQFALLDATLPEAGLHPSWQAETHPLPQHPDENTPRKAEDRLQAINFKVATEAYAYGLADSTPRPLLHVRLCRLAPADAAPGEFTVVSNARTRVEPILMDPRNAVPSP